MKKIIILFIVNPGAMTMVSCDNGFEDLNIDPTASAELECESEIRIFVLKISR